jgi:hypothetical protein
MKPHAPTTPPAKTDAKPKLKSGLPGTPAERRAQIKAAVKANRETLRRLAK